MSSLAENIRGIFFTISSFTSATVQLSSMFTRPDDIDTPRTQKKSLRERVLGLRNEVVIHKYGATRRRMMMIFD